MDAAAKQQIVERLKQANNVLVTVSNNPTVDQLAACIGLTLMLTKLDKHATAVFSGAVPSTIEFLQPAKTIETNTDSLRDFIISLDKSKADKLRYKVEDNVVRIFITPYKTKISQADLIFSEGDFNVEVVMALGVHDRSQIDAAITAHGRILHDATVISVNTGKGPLSDIGQINWQDPAASSLCEMLVSISEAFGTGLIDAQMATAFLTGIVAETNRFSNDHTTPRVMTMSAQLMAAGANQQLIATKLDQAVTVSPKKVAKANQPATGGELNVSHEKSKADSPPVEIKPGEIKIDEAGNILTGKAELPQPKAETPPPAPPKMPSPPPPPPPPPKLEPAPIAPMSSPQPPSTPTPINKGNHALLDPGSQPFMNSPFSATTMPSGPVADTRLPTDPLSAGSGPGNVINATAADISASQPPPDLGQARDAVQSAIQSAPFDPAFDRLTGLGSQQVNLGLHGEIPTPPVPAADTSGTPSLNLPEANAQPPGDDKPPPPPVPPPFMPTPGAMPDQPPKK